MLMLSDLDYMNAIRAMIIAVFIPFILGLFFIFQARRTKAKLLFYFGIAVFITFFTGLWTLDFITILLTGHNMDGQLYHFLIRTTPPISFFLMSYIVAEILTPKKKWYFISITLALNVLYLLDLYIFVWTPVITIYPEDIGLLPGARFLISMHRSAFADRWWIFSWTISIAAGLGILYKNIGMKGIIRKKYFFLSSSFIIIGVLELIRPSLPTWFG
ncbi:MAG: hypothetical protein ACFE8G_15210, partial [Candidatus Hermodarchaeota archaeon]